MTKHYDCTASIPLCIVTVEFRGYGRVLWVHLNRGRLLVFSSSSLDLQPVAFLLSLPLSLSLFWPFSSRTDSLSPLLVCLSLPVSFSPAFIFLILGRLDLLLSHSCLPLVYRPLLLLLFSLTFTKTTPAASFLASRNSRPSSASSCFAGLGSH